MRALDGTWPDPWTSVAAAGQGYASPRRVVGASANANGDLQVVVVDGQGMLWHTIRTANGTWPYPWGNVLGTVPPNIGPTPFAAVSADPSSNLHVLVLDEQDQAWYTIRDADGSWPSAWLGVEAPAGS